MLGNSNKEYLEQIVLLKQQLQTDSEKEKILTYETLYNRYVRMGLLLEAEKISYDHIALLRKTLPKNKLVIDELRLAQLLIDNGRIEQGIEHLNYAIGFCSLNDAHDKEQYLCSLMNIYYKLSVRDATYKPLYTEYLYRYETEIQPHTTQEKLDYYMELCGSYFNSNNREKGLAYKARFETLLEKSTDLNDAYKERYRNYRQQLDLAEMKTDPDQRTLITRGKAVLARNKQENFLPSAGVFFWLRTLANAYLKENDIKGLKENFNELYYSINQYLEENIEAKIYEQKYQSDYFLQEQKLKDSEALNKVKDSVFSNFNHELRTPLNIILSNCELLARDIGNNRKLDAIQNQSYNLLNIIDQFIEINKTNLQFNQVNNEVGDLVQFLQTMEIDFGTLCEQKKITLAFKVNGLKQLLCKLDFAKLERILYNLVTNAIKFTDTGGKVTITLLADKKKKQLHLAVADTGIGIAPAELGTIFEQFYSPRNDNANLKTSVGFGIGLYLVKQLSTLLDGSVQVISKPGKGSTFTVHLPLVIYKATAKRFTVKRRLNYGYDKSTVPVAAKQAKAGKEAPNLLIVEDNQDLLDVITESLAGGFNIKTATNGREACELLNNFLPDLVITDLMMPLMNGIELTTYIKSAQALNHLPVIMLTAKGSLPNRIKGWQAGIDMFLRKPFAMAELEQCIENIIQTRSNAIHRIEKLLTNALYNKSKPPTAAEKFVSDFKNYVLTQISNSDIHNRDIAKHLQVDENSMYRKIKALTGLSPVQLVTKLKILKAEEFIAAGKYTTLKEVAYNSGFNDPKYFSQVYKAEKGALPKVK